MTLPFPPRYPLPLPPYRYLPLPFPPGHPPPVPVAVIGLPHDYSYDLLLILDGLVPDPLPLSFTVVQILDSPRRSPYIVIYMIIPLHASLAAATPLLGRLPQPGDLPSVYLLL